MFVHIFELSAWTSAVSKLLSPSTNMKGDAATLDIKFLRFFIFNLLVECQSCLNILATISIFKTEVKKLAVKINLEERCMFGRIRPVLSFSNKDVFVNSSMYNTGRFVI